MPLRAKLIGDACFTVLLLVLTSPARPTVAAETVSWTNVAPGLDYANLRVTNQPWSIHIARLDRSHPEFELVCTHALNKIAALSTVASQLKTIPQSVGTPIAAVNADFFVIAKTPYQGDPLGLQIIRGELSSAPAGPSLIIEPGETMSLLNVTSRFSITWPHGTRTAIGLNEERKLGSIVLFTPAFAASTRTTNGTELILESDANDTWPPLRADKNCRVRVREIREGGNSPLVANTAVVSIDPAIAAEFSGIKPGATLVLSTATSPDISRAQYAVGGHPFLILHGSEQHWTAKGTNTLPRHPRTAIGWNRESLFLVAVDGRQKDLSVGMTFPELAHFMKSLACAEALNLDGGGSTTFWLNGQIMNSPSDKHERPVANSLVIVKRPAN